jgi:sortase A
MKWLGRLLAVVGVILLGYCGYAIADSWIFQQRESAELEQLQQQPAAVAALRPPAIVQGLVGRIDVPRLGVSVVVLEGDSSAILRRAAGHIPGTALPGGPGNVGISAHRDTFFRPLRNVQENEIITLTTVAGEYRYRVVSMKVVKPENVEVLEQSADEVLTLVTCYPFYYVGPAPNRFVVRAERVI